MKKTLLASAIALAFGVCGTAFAAANDQTSGDTGTNTSTDTTTLTVTATDSSTRTRTDSSVNGDATAGAVRSAALNNGSTGTFTNAFNSTRVVALSRLEGTVTGNTVS